MGSDLVLGIDDKHVIASAMQTLDEVSPLLSQHLSVLLTGPTDLGRILTEIDAVSADLRPRLLADSSPDHWFSMVDTDDFLDQVWDLVDKARRQLELLDAVSRVSRRLEHDLLAATVA